MSESPGLIAVRAVHQYRKRDVIGYFGARYLLNSRAAQSDRWASEVAVDLVTRRPSHAYFISHHFKGQDDDGSFVTREIAIPSPLEILAETALLFECAKRPEFKNPDCVYTYQLAGQWDRSGSFSNYWEGLRRRHKDIANYCRTAESDAVVRYLDIRKFYPSITHKDAAEAWAKYSLGLGESFRALGERLLADHADAGRGSSQGILTGPMFSHLIANLVLRGVDQWAVSLKGVKYLRYVDDITLIGGRARVDHVERELISRLSELGLALHDHTSPKSITVSASEWMSGQADYDDHDDDISWKGFVGDIKSFLLANPDESSGLRDAFLGMGMRIPVQDYVSESREASFVGVVRSLARRASYRIRARGLTVKGLISDAVRLKKKLSAEIDPIVNRLAEVQGYQQKRLLPKARFRAGRLVYLAGADLLRQLAMEAAKTPDLRMHAEVMNATATGDVSTVLSMGANAVQSAAQPLRSERASVQLSGGLYSEVEVQGLAVLNLNGLKVADVAPLNDSASSDLLRISMSAVTRELMTSQRPFIREVSSLVGLGVQSHPEFLNSPFDESDELILDAAERLDESVPLGG